MEREKHEKVMKGGVRHSRRLGLSGSVHRITHLWTLAGPFQGLSLPGRAGRTVTFPFRSPNRFIDTVCQQECEIVRETPAQHSRCRQGKTNNEPEWRRRRFQKDARVLPVQDGAEGRGNGQFALPAMEKTVRIARRQGPDELVTVIQLVRSMFFRQKTLIAIDMLHHKVCTGVPHLPDRCRFQLKEKNRFPGRVPQERLQGQADTGLTARLLYHGELVGDDDRQIGKGHGLDGEGNHTAEAAAA